MMQALFVEPCSGCFRRRFGVAQNTLNPSPFQPILAWASPREFRNRSR